MTVPWRNAANVEWDKESKGQIRWALTWNNPQSRGDTGFRYWDKKAWWPVCAGTTTPLLTCKFIISRYILQLYKQVSYTAYAGLVTVIISFSYWLISTVKGLQWQIGFSYWKKPILKIVTRHYWSMCSWQEACLKAVALKQPEQICSCGFSSLNCGTCVSVQLNARGKQHWPLSQCERCPSVRQLQHSCSRSVN